MIKNMVIFLIFFAVQFPSFLICQEYRIDELMQMDLKDLLKIKVVTAARKSQILSEAPANVIVISSNMIRRRGYQNLEEALRDLPGFDFISSQPSGEHPTHFIFRGMTDAGQTKLLIMIDGVIRNDISNGWFRFMGYNMPMSDIERIEVISGPGSALYGANAYAGLIHIITKSVKDQFDVHSDRNYFVDFRQIAGPNQTYSPEIFAGYRFDNGLTLQATARWYDTDGDNAVDRYDPGNYYHHNFEPDSVTTTEYGVIANEREPDGSRKKIADGFKTNINDMAIRIRLQKEGFTLGFNYWEKDDGLGSQIVGYEYFTNTDGLDYQVHNQGICGFGSYQFQFNDQIEFKTRLLYRNTRVLPNTGFYYTHQYQSVDNGVNPPVVDKKKGYNSEGFLFGFDQQADIQTSDQNDLTLGFQVEQRINQYFGISLGPEQRTSSTIVDYAYSSEETIVQPMYFSKNAAFFVQDYYRMSDAYLLTTGIRYDTDNQYGDVWNPRLAFTGKPLQFLRFKLLYGEAYKSPTIFELFDEWRGNTELKSQSISTYEVEIGFQPLQTASLGLNCFYNRLTDLIVEKPNPDTSLVPVGPRDEKVTYYQNVGATEISGMTASAKLLPSKNFRFFADYTLTLGENGNEVDNISKHKFNFVANYLLLNKFNVNIRGNLVSKIKAPISNRYFYPKDEESIQSVGYDYMIEDDPDGYLEGYFLCNLTLTGIDLFPDLTRKFSVEPQLIIRNLFDKDYLGIGRQTGSGVRPVDEIQPEIRNPKGFIPAYHPQPGREIFFAITCLF